jgi:hypothetical protein
MISDGFYRTIMYSSRDIAGCGRLCRDYGSSHRDLQGFRWALESSQRYLRYYNSDSRSQVRDNFVVLATV